MSPYLSSCFGYPLLAACFQLSPRPCRLRCQSPYIAGARSSRFPAKGRRPHKANMRCTRQIAHMGLSRSQITNEHTKPELKQGWSSDPLHRKPREMCNVHGFAPARTHFLSLQGRLPTLCRWCPFSTRSLRERWNMSRGIANAALGPALPFDRELLAPET